MHSVTIRVPASSANLGPGFDCLGLPLSLWNETTFSQTQNGLTLEIQGEGAKDLPTDNSNAVMQAFYAAYDAARLDPPAGLHVHCINRIPLGSGLGSSAAALLTGLRGANKLMGNPLDNQRLLELAATMEGHPDNVAPALFGGLNLARMDAGQVIARQVELPPWKAIVVLPEFRLSTNNARQALPDSYRFDAVFTNLANVVLVVEALRTGDLPLLRNTMHDNVHQPFRLPLIPGAGRAIQAARDLGAAACLSGAGPAVIAFHQGNGARLEQAMHTAFGETATRTWHLDVVNSID